MPDTSSERRHITLIEALAAAGTLCVAAVVLYMVFLYRPG